MTARRPVSALTDQGQPPSPGWFLCAVHGWQRLVRGVEACPVCQLGERKSA